MNQDKIFYKKEGDEWFNRNKDYISRNKCDKDFPIRIIEMLGLKPEKTLEIGASNGYRLAEISKKLEKGKYVAVEPSKIAIEDGKKKYPFIDFRRGLMYNLPMEDEKFDLVIVNFVFHWVEREHLLRSVAEIDRVLNNGGYLIIGDFLPDVPTKVKYHHLPDKGVYTYKQDYANIFISSEQYNLILRHTFDHDSNAVSSEVDSNSRGVCSCLKKNQDGKYIEKKFE